MALARPGFQLQGCRESRAVAPPPRGRGDAVMAPCPGAWHWATSPPLAASHPCSRLRGRLLRQAPAGAGMKGWPGGAGGMRGGGARPPPSCHGTVSRRLSQRASPPAPIATAAVAGLRAGLGPGDRMRRRGRQGAAGSREPQLPRLQVGPLRPRAKPPGSAPGAASASARPWALTSDRDGLPPSPERPRAPARAPAAPWPVAALARPGEGVRRPPRRLRVRVRWCPGGRISPRDVGIPVCAPGLAPRSLWHGLRLPGATGPLPEGRRPRGTKRS